MKTQDIIVIISIVASFIIAMTSILTSFFLNEPYLIPRDPQLKIWINTFEDVPQADFDYITSKYSITGENGYMPLCVFNEGRGVSGHLNLRWSANWNTSNITSNRYNIDFIEGGNGTCFPIDIRAVCHNSNLDNPCNKNQIKSQIPNGIQTINLIVECTFCENKLEIYPFKICIWENNPDECKYK